MTGDKDESLRVAYEQLNEHVRSREALRMTVMSILLPASLLIATLSFDPGIKGNANNTFPVLGVSALPAASILIAVLALAYAITGQGVDKIYWNHIHNLESKLGITEGQATVWEDLNKRRLHRVRQYLFPIALILALISYTLLFYHLL